MEEKFTEMLPSKSVIESLILARARTDSGIYGQRLIVRLVEYTQKYVRGDNFDKVLGKERIEVGLWGDAVITMPVSDLLPGADDKNHEAAKKAIRQLAKATLEYEDEEEWKVTNILGRATIKKGTGIAELFVMRDVWEAMLNFSKGYYQYDPDVAVRLKKESSLRIYKALTGMWDSHTSLKYGWDKLRVLLGVEPNKYPKDADLIAHLLKPSKEELDSISEYSFTYSLYYNSASGKRGKRKAAGVVLTPIHLVCNAKTASAAKSTHPGNILSRELYDMLTNKFGFEYGGLKANVTTFHQAVKLMGEGAYLNWLSALAPEALRVPNPQGYVINATKKMLRAKYGSTQESDPRAARLGTPTPLADVVGGLFADVAKKP